MGKGAPGSGQYQFGELVVGFEAAEQAAELVVVGVLSEALLRPQDVARARHQVVQKLAALLVAHKQRPPHRRQPHLRDRSDFHEHEIPCAL